MWSKNLLKTNLNILNQAELAILIIVPTGPIIQDTKFSRPISLLNWCIISCVRLAIFLISFKRYISWIIFISTSSFIASISFFNKSWPIPNWVAACVAATPKGIVAPKVQKAAAKNPAAAAEAIEHQIIYLDLWRSKSEHFSLIHLFYFEFFLHLKKIF